MRTNSIDGAVFLLSSAALDLAGSTGDFMQRPLRSLIGVLWNHVDDRLAPGLVGDTPTATCCRRTTAARVS